MTGSGIFIAIVACLFQLAQATEDFIEILTPPDEVSVRTDYVHVIGRTSAQQVRVELNGAELGVIEVRDSVFHYHVSYGYGLNTLDLTPMSEDLMPLSEGSARLQIMYGGPIVSRKYKSLFPDYIYHNTEPRDECIGCHDYSGADPGEVADGAICMDCHRDFRQHFRKHVKADDKMCINCHQVDQSPNGVMALKDSKEPCFQCHKDEVDKFAQEVIHGPVAGGSCTVCHDPHGSQYQNNLKNPEPVLCLTCHQTIAEELRLDVVHAPFAAGQCSSCHDAHSTANRSVLVKSPEEVCLGCHLEEGTLESHEHPYNVPPLGPIEADLKLTKQGTLECLTCHEPHSTNSANLLRLSNRFDCIGCHDDKR